MYMKTLSSNSIILIRYPFSDLSNSKIRPAIIISSPHPSEDLFIVPLTSRTDRLQTGEFILENWRSAGLNVPSAVKRGIYTISRTLIIKIIGVLDQNDVLRLKKSVMSWLCWK
jgi:mRNA interferase MazF